MARFALLLTLLGAFVARASAQDTPPPETLPPETPPPATEAAAPAPDQATPAATASAETPPPATAPSVPPVMVVATATGRVPPELVEAVRTQLVTQLTPMSGGRPVLPLTLDTMQAAIVACGEDAACIGSQIAGAGAIGAVIATLSRRTARGPVALTLDMRDPVSGSPRLPAQAASLDPAGDVAAALTPLTAALAPVFFSPPPPPPELLVTVNVDGAEVLVDGESIGRTPVAAARLTPGTHVVMVTAVGYSGTRREVQLDPGERERLDITLSASTAVPMDEVIAADGTVSDRPREWYEEWWPWVIIGGVVVVGVGVGVGVGVATSGPPPDPMGIPLPPIR